MSEYKLQFNDKKPYLFISYKSDDKQIVRENVEYLQTVYGINLWFDADLTAGRNWDEEALPVLRDECCRGVLFFASEEALMSPNVAKELDKAERYSKPIIPINFSEESFDKVLMEINRKNNRARSIDVTNAETLIERFLPANKTYLYLNKANYYEELIKAIRRTAEDVIIHDEATIEENIRARNRNSACKEPGKAPSAAAATPAAPITPPAPAPREEAPSQVEPPAPAPQTDDTPPQARTAKKAHTITGDIAFTLYGQSYTENQSGMMLAIFREVIRRHPDAVDDLIAQLTCASAVDYDDPANRGVDMPSYFRVCQTFRLGEAGRQICIGTAYGYQEKCKLLSKLFQITGESRDVLVGVELPPLPGSAGRRGRRSSNGPVLL